ncbi:MAG: hypothetical protein LBU23_02700 [Planctomycetota bacterium]|jgi:hypothetical protein|nr:hypothetical protein [Planctomycetota bacterium]
MTRLLRLRLAILAGPMLALALAALVPDGAAGADGGGGDTVTSASPDAASGATPPAGQLRASEKAEFTYRVQPGGALEIWASELAAAYAANEPAADALFKDKELILLGRVEKTGGAGAARPWISLSDGRGGKVIRCLLAPGASLAGAPERGGKAAVRGICQGMTLGITLRDAQLVDFP